jgi:MFS family permease
MSTVALGVETATPGRAQYVRLAQVIGVLFVGYLIIGIPLPVLPLYVHRDLGFGPFMVGTVAGAQFAASLVSRMFAGRFTDTRGPKSAFVVGLLLTAASGLLYLASLPFADVPVTSVSLLLVGRVLLGFGESYIVTGALGWGLILLGSASAGKAMSWLGTSLYAAFAIGAPIGSSLYGHWGFSAVAVATVLMPLVALALVAPMRGVSPPPPAPAGLKKVLAVVWVPGTTLALSGVGFSAIMTFASLLYASRHWSPAWLPFTALSVAFIFGRVVLGHLPDKLGGVRVALVCIAVEAIGQALIWLAPNATIAFIGVAVTGLGYSLVYPGLGTEVVQAASPQSRALALGAYTAFLDVSLGFSGPLLGLIATGRDLSIIYAVSTFVVLASTGLTIWMLRRHQTPAGRKSQCARQ